MFITNLEIAFISKFPSAFEVPRVSLWACWLPWATRAASPRGSDPSCVSWESLVSVCVCCLMVILQHKVTGSVPLFFPFWVVFFF